MSAWTKITIILNASCPIILASVRDDSEVFQLKQNSKAWQPMNNVEDGSCVTQPREISV